jgi:hypothetical protein
VHAKVTARWDFEAPPGGKDSLYSLLRGSRADLIIKQGPEQHYLPILYVENKTATSADEFERALRAALRKLAVTYPGLEARRAGGLWEVVVPEKYNVGHEAHFAQVTESFLRYLAAGKMPSWEVPNMIAKYFTTTEAYRLSHVVEKSQAPNHSHRN